jgi:hypothetical protein
MSWPQNPCLATPYWSRDRVGNGWSTPFLDNEIRFRGPVEATVVVAVFRTRSRPHIRVACRRPSSVAARSPSPVSGVNRAVDPPRAAISQNLCVTDGRHQRTSVSPWRKHAFFPREVDRASPPHSFARRRIGACWCVPRLSPSAVLLCGLQPVWSGRRCECNAPAVSHILEPCHSCRTSHALRRRTVGPSDPVDVAFLARPSFVVGG